MFLFSPLVQGLFCFLYLSILYLECHAVMAWCKQQKHLQLTYSAIYKSPTIWKCSTLRINSISHFPKSLSRQPGVVKGVKGSQQMPMLFINLIHYLVGYQTELLWRPPKLSYHAWITAWISQMLQENTQPFLCIGRCLIFAHNFFR